VKLSTLNHNTAFAVPELRALLRGRVLTAADPDYHEVRATFYGGFDRRPAAIVRPADAADVARVVTFAREAGLELAVRSGGHSFAGHGTTEGGILLDLRSLKALEIDAAGRAAWAQTGLTAGEYTAATAAHGLATGFGDSGSVGVGGITLGGGIGYLARKHGLTIDSLLAAEVVTADGAVRHVDATSDPDLFWAIRGGGGNFGVVTRFQFRLHEVDTVVGGPLILPATPDVIASFVAAAEAAPDELSTIANIMPAPPLPFLSAEQHGQLVIMATLVYAGDVDAGLRAIAPFRALATPLADLVRPMRYAELFAQPERGDHPFAVVRTLFVDAIDRELGATIVDHLRAGSAPMRVAQLRVLGGAMARVPDVATAVAHRRRRIMVTITSMDGRPDALATHEAWAHAFAAALRRDEPGAYVNFLGNDGETRLREAYPSTTWDRLVALKRRYDPTNLFRVNQNIPPGAEQPEQTGGIRAASRDRSADRHDRPAPVAAAAP
jgi:FAD/FMN-containing dehydrogenase